MESCPGALYRGGWRSRTVPAARAPGAAGAGGSFRAVALCDGGLDQRGAGLGGSSFKGSA